MTTTMVVAIAAVVVFIVVSIIAITILKKESRKRTASIKAIEKSINKMSSDLTENIRLSNDIAMELNADLQFMYEVYEESVANNNVATPIGVTTPAEMDVMINETIESTGIADTGEISFDFLDLDAFETVEEMVYEEDLEPAGEYIVGRSGKKYTAKELEELIKE